MFKNKITAALIAITGMAISAGAQAQAYVGGTVGQSFWNLDCPVDNCKKNDTGYKIIAGYNIDQHWGVEATYFSVGKATGEANILGVKVIGGLKGTGFDIAGVYRMDLGNNWGMFSKIGVAQTKGETTNEFNIAGINFLNSSNSETTTQPVVGLGLTYAINKNLAFRADMDTRRVKAPRFSVGSVTSMNVGLQASF